MRNWSKDTAVLSELIVNLRNFQFRRQNQRFLMAKSSKEFISEKVLLRRERNKKAAKISREKNRIYIELLEQNNKNLIIENQQLKEENQQLQLDQEMQKLTNSIENRFMNQPCFIFSS